MALSRVCVIIGYQFLNNCNHLGNMRSRARLCIWQQRAKRTHINMECVYESLGNVRNVFARIPRDGDDLIVNIGDIASVRNVVRAVCIAQQPVEHVEYHNRSCVTDMGEIVDRRPAHIHTDVVSVNWLERFLPSGQRVVNRQCQISLRRPVAGPQILISVVSAVGRARRGSLSLRYTEYAILRTYLPLRGTQWTEYRRTHGQQEVHSQNFIRALSNFHRLVYGLPLNALTIG